MSAEGNDLDALKARDAQLAEEIRRGLDRGISVIHLVRRQAAIRAEVAVREGQV